MNQISVHFETCSPAPSKGYRFYWRNITAGGPLIYLGNYFTSPIVFNDDGPGMDYEGFIRSEYNDPNLTCTNEEWSTIIPSGGSGSGATCKVHNFAVFGPDDSTYVVTGLNCDSSPYDSGIRYVGDGGLVVCLISGTYSIVNYGTGGAILQSANDDCVSGNAIFGALWGDLDGICAAIPEALFLDAGHIIIQPGAFLYYDSALTMPVIGFMFVKDVAGEVFYLDFDDGRVLSPEGLLC